MTKVLYFFCICFCIGCASTAETTKNKPTTDIQIGDVYVGMPLYEFKDNVPNNSFILLKGELAVYKSDLSAYLKSTDTVSVKSVRKSFRYFYFINDELTNIDEGSALINYRMGIQ